mmetsp:Transcript_8597/g.20104  ORF Transcript_8597/g.20104 Transcript_8597/m.20104 type:complete len:160 (+) Transcript_8597:469-948(+)
MIAQASLPKSSFCLEQCGHQYAPYILAPVLLRYLASSIACGVEFRLTREGTMTVSPDFSSVTGKYPSSSAIMAKGGAADDGRGVSSVAAEAAEARPAVARFSMSLLRTRSGEVEVDRAAVSAASEASETTEKADSSRCPPMIDVVKGQCCARREAGVEC